MSKKKKQGEEKSALPTVKELQNGTLGAFLRLHRNTKTLQKLNKLTGVAPSTISVIEHDKALCRIDTLVDLVETVPGSRVVVETPQGKFHIKRHSLKLMEVLRTK